MLIAYFTLIKDYYIKVLFFIEDDMESISLACQSDKTNGTDTCVYFEEPDGTEIWNCICHSDLCNKATYIHINYLWMVVMAIITVMSTIMDI